MYGYAPKNGKFQIDLVPEYEQGGYSLEDAVCLRMVVDIDTYHIVRNAFAHGSEWFAQEDDGYSGLLPGRYFTMSIICQMYGYEIVVNGYHFATFYHRIPITQTMWITVDPHVRLEPMEYY